MSYLSTILAEPSLISYWRLDEPSGTTATDQTAAHTGTYSGTPTFSQTSLVANTSDAAVLFPSTTSFVQASTGHIVGGLTNFTIECWVKYTSAAGNNKDLYCERATSGGTDIVRFSINTANTSFALLYRDTASTLNTINSGTFTAINDGNPHYVLVTKSGTTVLFYIDGVQKTGGTLTASNTLSQTTPSFIGTDPQNGLLFNAITMDEVALYNAALGSSTVTSHYTIGSTLPSSPSVVSAASILPLLSLVKKI